MSHRDEIQLFSTSFIDLMACSLAGACILWILTLDAEPAAEVPPPRRSVWVLVSQPGASHVDREALRVETGTESWTADDFAAQSPRTTARGASLHLEVTQQLGGFGGRVHLLAENLREDLRLTFEVGQCVETSELHPILADLVDRDGPRSEILFWTHLPSLELGAARVRTPSSASTRYLLEDLRAHLDASEPRPPLRVLDPAAGGTLSWTVAIDEAGRAHLEVPAADPAATARLQGLLTPGGTAP